MVYELRRILDEYLPDIAMLKGSIDTFLIGKLVLVRDEYSRGLLIASGGKGEMFVEVTRVGNKVYVPTSSIKGVLRRIGEAIAKRIASSIPELERGVVLAHCELEDEGVTHICNDITSLIEMLRHRDSLSLLAEKGYIPRDAVDEILEQLSSKDQLVKGVKRVESLLSELCPICRVFGGPGLAGKLRILRVELSNDDPSRSISRLTHISIDRGRRVVLEEALFVEEYADIEKIFIEFVARNIAPGSVDYKLLIATLNVLKDVPLLLGHSKSRGLGWYKLNTAETKLVYLDLTKIQNADHLINAILNPFSYGEEVEIR